MEKKAVIFLADGFEDIEAITPIDILSRAKIETLKVAIFSCKATSSHGVEIACDINIDDFFKKYFSVLNEFSLFILPGGMPGAKNLSECEALKEIICKAHTQKKLIAAICAAPAVTLSAFGVLTSESVTCYPSCEVNFPPTVNAMLEYGVVVTKNLITAKGPAFAFHFALELVRALKGEEEAKVVARGALFEFEAKIFRE